MITLRMPLFLLFAVLLSACAGQKPPSVNQPDATDVSHRQLVAQLLDHMSLDVMLEELTNRLVMQQVQQTPELSLYDDILFDFFNKHLTYAKLRDDYITLYAENFTSDEIRGLHKFYQTPLGKKSLEKMPRIASASAAIGEQIVADNIDELVRALEARKAAMTEQWRDNPDFRAGNVVVADSSGQFELTVPSHWNTAMELNDEAVIQTGFAPQEVYAAVLAERKIDLGMMSMDEFKEITRSSIFAGLDNAAASEEFAYELNGLPAVQMEIAGHVNGIDVTYVHTVIDGTDHVFQVLAWTLTDLFEKNRSLISSVVDSFREVPIVTVISDYQ